MTTNQYVTHNQPPKGPGFFRENRALIAIAVLFVLYAVFGDSAYVVQLGHQIKDLVANVLQWAAAAVVVLALGRILWPFIRPFVCMAIGLVALWALFRAGIFTL